MSDGNSVSTSSTLSRFLTHLEALLGLHQRRSHRRGPPAAGTRAANGRRKPPVPSAEGTPHHRRPRLRVRDHAVRAGLSAPGAALAVCGLARGIALPRPAERRIVPAARGRTRGARGHSILAADIARRFPRSLSDLLELYAGAVDDASCFINSGPAPDIVFTQQGDQRTILDPAVFDQLVKAAQP